MKKTRYVCWMLMISLIFLTACSGKKDSDADKKQMAGGTEKKTIEKITEEISESPTESTEQEETTEAVEDVLQTEAQEETTEEIQDSIPEEIIQETTTEEPAEEEVITEEPEEITEATVQETEAVQTQENYPSAAEPAAVYAYTDTGDETLNRQCDQVLDTLIDSSMAEREKAYKIYQWVESHIRYSGVTAENGWVNGAKTALATGKGNCYAFYSVSAAMLTRAGFENLQVNEPDYSHYWNLVKVDGSWYHWDTTAGWGGERFLFTDAQLETYTYYNASVGETLSYHWDHASVPATP